MVVSDVTKLMERLESRGLAIKYPYLSKATGVHHSAPAEISSLLLNEVAGRELDLQDIKEFGLLDVLYSRLASKDASEARERFEERMKYYDFNDRDISTRLEELNKKNLTGLYISSRDAAPFIVMDQPGLERYIIDGIERLAGKILRKP